MYSTRYIALEKNTLHIKFKVNKINRYIYMHL